MPTYTFGYGSLLNPVSLKSTLPNTDIDSLIPARIGGYLRRWNVAFPNDGSQRDKAYVDINNQRPPFVLFSNITPYDLATDSNAVNGVLIPVSHRELERLKSRERRYDLVEVTACVALYDRKVRLSGDAQVFAFSGRQVFSHPSDVERGCIPQSYLNTIQDGVTFWEKRCRGFEKDFHVSTTLTKPSDIVDLRLV